MLQVRAQTRALTDNASARYQARPPLGKLPPQPAIVLAFVSRRSLTFRSTICQKIRPVGGDRTGVIERYDSGSQPAFPELLGRSRPRLTPRSFAEGPILKVDHESVMRMCRAVIHLLSTDVWKDALVVA